MLVPSKRVSVKSFNVPLLESTAQEIGTDDYSEALNWILIEYRRLKQGTVQSPAQPHNPSTALPASTDDDLAETLLAAI